jgi:hypothetical protein
MDSVSVVAAAMHDVIAAVMRDDVLVVDVMVVVL